MTKTEKRLTEIERTLAANKTVLNIDEAAAYLNFAKSYLYKLTHLRRVPFYKPSGKKIFFYKVELDAWLLKNPVMMDHQLETAGSTYITTNKKN